MEYAKLALQAGTEVTNVARAEGGDIAQEGTGARRYEEYAAEGELGPS